MTTGFFRYDFNDQPSALSRSFSLSTPLVEIVNLICRLPRSSVTATDCFLTMASVLSSPLRICCFHVDNSRTGDVSEVCIELGIKKAVETDVCQLLPRTSSWRGNSGIRCQPVACQKERRVSIIQS